jgi:hypothetical protein
VIDISQYASPLADPGVRERIDNSLREAMLDKSVLGKSEPARRPPLSVEISMARRAPSSTGSAYILGRKERPAESPSDGPGVHRASSGTSARRSSRTTTSMSGSRQLVPRRGLAAATRARAGTRRRRGALEDKRRRDAERGKFIIAAYHSRRAACTAVE